MNETPTLLLVHGAWHGPWCWDRLVPELRKLGVDTATVALPSVGDIATELGGVAEDAAAIVSAAEAIAGPVVVVAHSYAGVPTTQAPLPANVRHLVYLGAFMPDMGQSLVSLLPPGPLPPFVVGHPDGTTSVDPSLAVATFYADCDPETASWAADRLRHHNGIVNVTPVDHCSWRENSATYILLTEDYACPTPLQRELRSQAGDSLELHGSHSPFLAQPAALAAILSEICVEHAGRNAFQPT